MEPDYLRSLLTARSWGPGDLHRALVMRGFGKSEALVRAWVSGASEPTEEDVMLIGAALDVVGVAERQALAVGLGKGLVEWVNGGTA